MDTYIEKQQMPTLKQLSVLLSEDREISYVTETSQKVADTKKYEVGENPTSIYTKLEEYPYEFEIDDELKLASIDGIQIADNSNQKQIEELRNIIGDFQTKITLMEGKITSLETELQQVGQEKYDYTVNKEKKIGKWYDGSDMYELSLSVTIPNASKEGDVQAKNTVDLQKYNIKECNIVEGFVILNNKYIVSLPIWSSYRESAIGLRVNYYANNNLLEVVNSKPDYNGAKGYVTLHFNKNS